MAYIKLEDALQVCSEAEEWYTETNEQQCAVVSDDIYQQIANLPTADVVEVKHGKWIWDIEDKYRCSCCGDITRVDEVMNQPKYEWCPFCGAKMDGGSEDNDHRKHKQNN